MRLLERDGWTQGRRTNHGIFFYKQLPGENRPRTTVIPDKSEPLPTGQIRTATQRNAWRNPRPETNGYREERAASAD